MNPLAYFIISNYFFHPRARAHVNSHGHGHVNDYECVRDRDCDYDHYSLFKGSGSQASFSKHFLTRMH